MFPIGKREIHGLDFTLSSFIHVLNETMLKKSRGEWRMILGFVAEIKEENVSAMIYKAKIFPQAWRKNQSLSLRIGASSRDNDAIWSIFEGLVESEKGVIFFKVESSPFPPTKIIPFPGYNMAPETVSKLFST